VVLANKRPLSGPQADVDCLFEAARCSGRRLLHEATVGAGLPVVDTIRKLLDAGDRIRAIEGCPSGTLGFLFAELGKGRAFSSALRDAVAAGYTEPDPRTDLSGLDVARKALILARLIGYRGEPGQIAIESLVPPELREVSAPDFLDRAAELDDRWRERVRAAAERGCALRYRVHVTSRSLAVGLAEVPLADPLANLSGTDNQFTFMTERYGDQRLSITGPGAGPAVTAQGIYADLLRLAPEQIGRNDYGVLTSTPASRSALINAGS